MKELTINEISQRLGVSPDTIRRRIARGELRARKTSSPHGEIYLVELPQDQPPTPDIPVAAAPGSGEPIRTNPPGSPTSRPGQDPENTLLKRTIEILEDELIARQREIKELHILLQQAQNTALPSGQRQEAQQTAWWKRIFKGGKL